MEPSAAEDWPASSASSAVACSRSPRRDSCRRGDVFTVGTSHSKKRYIDSTAGPVRRAPDALSADDAPSAAVWYWLVRPGDPGGRRAGYPAGQRARPEAGGCRASRLQSEPVAVGIQRGRFALASRMRIPSSSASKSGASSATMAAARIVEAAGQGGRVGSDRVLLVRIDDVASAEFQQDFTPEITVRVFD